MPDVAQPFDRHLLWSSLDVNAKCGLLLADVSNLSAQIQIFRNGVDRQASELAELWQAFFRLDSVAQALETAIGAIEYNRAHPSQQPHPLPSTTVPPTKPQIDVTEKEDGKFEVTGTGFEHGATVRIRAADYYAQQIWAGTTTADGSGKIDTTVALNCIKGATINFSATDDREDSSDLTGVLWSNTFALTC